jgi:hypothetical protein
MQDYSNPASRNTMRAVGEKLKNGAAIGGGGNMTQGAGEIPGKVSVPMPGTDKTQSKQGGGMKGSVPGFSSGVIEGKISV